MRNVTRSVAVERRFPYLCKVIYFPEQKEHHSFSRAPNTQVSWYLRSSMLPRVGDVVPYSDSLFSVTTIILEDCCSSDAIAKVDKQAARIAEREDAPKWHAVIWVSFWGVKSQ
jgi:hypothetical protein